MSDELLNRIHRAQVHAGEQAVIQHLRQKEGRARSLPGPTPEMRDDPRFNAIWEAIKDWDIAVPEAYGGYCGATGNHVRAILDAIASVS